MDQSACESVADHSFGVAVACCLIGDAYFPELDLNKVMRMALIHDLGESRIGDLTPYSGVPAEEKKRRELAAVEQIFAGLPNAQEYVALWRELAAGDSPEARFVKEIDSLEMAFQAAFYEQDGGYDLGEFFHHAAGKIDTPMLRRLVQQARELVSSHIKPT